MFDRNSDIFKGFEKEEVVMEHVEFQKCLKELSDADMAKEFFEEADFTKEQQLIFSRTVVEKLQKVIEDLEKKDNRYYPIESGGK